MKISRHQSTVSSKGSLKTGSAGASAQTFEPSIANGHAKDVDVTAVISQVQNLSSLICLQSDGDSKQKLIAESHRAMNLLDQIQQGLLNGKIYKNDLTSLAALTASSGKNTSIANDPDLKSLFDIFNDISLRARVELAKLGQ